jgi:hypothetical protein
VGLWYSEKRGPLCSVSTVSASAALAFCTAINQSAIFALFCLLFHPTSTLFCLVLSLELRESPVGGLEIYRGRIGEGIACPSMVGLLSSF